MNANLHLMMRVAGSHLLRRSLSPPGKSWGYSVFGRVGEFSPEPAKSRQIPPTAKRAHPRFLQNPPLSAKFRHGRAEPQVFFRTRHNPPSCATGENCATNFFWNPSLPAKFRHERGERRDFLRTRHYPPNSANIEESAPEISPKPAIARQIPPGARMVLGNRAGASVRRRPTATFSCPRRFWGGIP
jgi:hypothetical protein